MTASGPNLQTFRFALKNQVNNRVGGYDHSRPERTLHPTRRLASPLFREVVSAVFKA